MLPSVSNSQTLSFYGTILRPVTYIGLINRFWRLDETYQFSTSETRVYFYLLKVANTLAWPAIFKHSDVRAAAALRCVATCIQGGT